MTVTSTLSVCTKVCLPDPLGCVIVFANLQVLHSLHVNVSTGTMVMAGSVLKCECHVYDLCIKCCCIYTSVMLVLCSVKL